MDFEEMKRRTKHFALAVIKAAEKLPISVITSIMVRQLTRCSTSARANYRAAVGQKSRSDFIAKMAIVEEERDESLYWWMEMLGKSKNVVPDYFKNEMKEGNELLSIVVSSIKPARSNKLCHPQTRKFGG